MAPINGSSTLIALLAMSVLLSACKRASHDGTGDHAHGDGGHEHEEKTAQITVWTNGFEIFAEHKPAVAGKPTTFVTHVTDLETQKPRIEGPVRFLLSSGRTQPLEHLQAGPTRPGIYMPALTFPTAGAWQLQIVIDDRTIHLGGIEVFADDQTAAHAVSPDAPEGISFLKEQQWKILTKAEFPQKRQLTESLRAPGTVQPAPGSLAQITLPFPGRFLPPPGKSTPTVGDRVEAGQILGLIQPALTEIGARFVQAEADVTRARLERDEADMIFKRVQKLAAAEARPARDLQEAEFNLKSAQARYDASLALQNAYRQTTMQAGTTSSNQFLFELKSPISGILSGQIPVAVGEYLTGDKPIFTVLDPSRVFLEGAVPESEIARLSDAKTAAYQRLQSQGLIPLAKSDGRLVYVGLQVNPSTRTVPVVYEIKNTDGLRPGEAIILHVQTRRSEDALAIPESAVVEENGQPIAFVQLSGETFEKRDLQLGIRDGAFVQVLAGLREGERVVTKGAVAIRLASVSSVIPAHGHAH